MAWSRTCRPVPPVAANIVSLIRRSILDRCLPTGGLRVHAFAAGLAGETVSGHRAIVVEPEEGDHLANIGVALDGAGRRSSRIGEDRVRNDSTLFSQLRPELLRKAEVSRPVAVQVADLPAAEFEPQLTKVTRHRMDARPGSDRCRDLISCRSCVRHELAPFGPNSVDSVIIPRYLARSPISMLSATKLSGTALACPPPSRPDARERETHDVARQLGHLLPAEGSLGKEAREDDLVGVGVALHAESSSMPRAPATLRRASRAVWCSPASGASVVPRAACLVRRALGTQSSRRRE